MFKKYFNLIFSIFCMAILILLSQTQFIQSFTVINFNDRTEDSKVFIKAKIFSNNQFYNNFKEFNYFKNRNIRNKYKAIEIEIENNTNIDYILSPNNIELSIIPPEKIKTWLKTNRILGPISSGIITCGLFIFGFGMAYIPSFLAGGTIGSSTQFINIEQNNNDLTKNISNKSINSLHMLLLPAHETTKTIVFIKNKNIKKNFKIKLNDFENNALEFNAQLI
ncbi:hypothetical protein GF322_01055 [Candidatus Dependentiae bacterium]|nr:hypothetical protein [Candidatus Dependentiae bacterium]